jgi:hypothetical protein
VVLAVVAQSNLQVLLAIKVLIHHQKETLVAVEQVQQHQAQAVVVVLVQQALHQQQEFQEWVE